MIECTPFEAVDIHQHCLPATRVQMHWSSLARETDLVPMLVREVVHASAPDEQFGRMLGLAVWLKTKGVQVLFNVAAPTTGPNPQHATLLWHEGTHPNPSRLSTKNIPEDCTQELWSISASGPVQRLIQPERVRYQVSMDQVPSCTEDRIHAAFSAWLDAPDAPVFLLEMKKGTQFVDISTWIANLPGQDLTQVVQGAWEVGPAKGLLLQMLARNGVIGAPDQALRKAQVFFAQPSPARIARRHHAILDACVEPVEPPRARSMRL